MKVSKIFYALILTILLIGSCEKDKFSELSREEDSTYQKNLSESLQNTEFSDFELAFQSHKNSVDHDTISVLNPLWHNIDIQSVVYTDYFGVPAIITNTLQSPFEYLPDMRNQILIKQFPDGEYEISSLIYVPDSVYYETNGYEPKLFNFTGYVVEYTEKELLTSIFIFDKGEIIDSETNLKNKKPKTGCFEFGKGLGDRIKDFFGGVISGIGRFFSGGGGSSSSGGSSGSGGIGGTSGMGFGGRTGQSSSGGGGGGGGNSSNPSICEDPSAFWSERDIMVKRNYGTALSQITSNFNISLCNDPYSSDGPCITLTEILCQAYDNNCFETAGSVNDFLECLTNILAPFNQPPVELPCQIAVETFNINHGTNFSAFGIAVLLGGFGDLCGNQEGFDDEVLNELCENTIDCSLCGERTTTLFDIIIKDESLLNCPKVNCIYETLANNMNQLFCNTIGNYMGSSVFDLKMRIANSLNDGVTNYFEEDDLVVITLDANFCNENSSELAIMSTILHEGIHAEMMRLLLDKGLNPNEADDYKVIWDEYIVDYYIENSGHVNDVQHAIMVRVEDYVTQIATALWSMNGEQLTIDHYKHYAWNGLRRYHIDYADDRFGMESPYYQLYQELLGTNPSFGCN